MIQYRAHEASLAQNEALQTSFELSRFATRFHSAQLSHCQHWCPWSEPWACLSQSSSRNKASNHCHNQYHEQLEVQHVCSQGWPSQNKSLGCQCLEAPSLFSEVSFCCTTKKGEIDGYFLESKSARSGEEKQLKSFWKAQSSFPKYWSSFCAFGISTTYWHISLLGFDFGWLGEVCVNLSLTRQTSRTLGTKFNQTASFTSSPKYQEAKE